MTKTSNSLLALGLFALATAETNTTNTNSTQVCLTNTGATFAFVNATTTLNVPAFAPPNMEAKNWTIHFGVHDVVVPTTNNGTKRYDQMPMWIDSQIGKDEGLTSKDNPYTGCMIGMEMLQYRKSTGTGESPQQSCKGVFSDKCYSAIVNYAKQAALNEVDAKKKTNCLDMIEFIDSSCNKDTEAWGAIGGSKMIFGNGTDNCTEPGVAKGSLLHAFAPLVTELDKESDDLAFYKRLVTKASPILMVAWLKNATADGERWSDARLMCPTPNKFEPGSTVVSETSVSGAMKSVPATHVAILASALFFFGMIS